MYCKNCGKYLEEGTRFCDRCGQSVRKNANSEQAVRHQNIEELKEERLNRKKRLAEMEAREAMKNKRKKKRRKQNRGLAAFMIIVVLLAVLSVVVAYLLMRSSSSITDGNNSEIVPSPQTTQAAAIGNPAINQTSMPQGTSAPVQTNGQQGAQTASSDDYRVFEINNIACPYPSDFGKKSVSGNEKLSLVDSAGGGIMSISQEQGVKSTPSEQMKDYASQLGGSVSYSLADKNGYAITVEKNNTVYHRKCLMSGSSAIYYDFQYSAMSSARARYEQCVSYIDNNMTAK